MSLDWQTNSQSGPCRSSRRDASGVGGEMRDTCGVGSGRAPVSSSSSAVGPEPREIEEISLNSDRDLWGGKRRNS